MTLANSPIYSPTPIAVQMQTEDGRFLQKYLQQQFQNISVALQQTTAEVFVPLSAAPSRPTSGMVVYADGANWDPGSGQGLYVYIDGSWFPAWVSSGGVVHSVSNSDGTLTISPTTGSVVASLALGHSNTWSATQTFSGLQINQNAITLPNATIVAGAGAALFGTDTINTGWNTVTFGAVGVNGFSAWGGTAGSPSALTSGTEIGRLGFSGAISSSVLSTNRGRINCFAAENWSATAYGTYFSIFTAIKGGGSPATTEKFRFQASGGLSIGNSQLTNDPGAGGIALNVYTVTTLPIGIAAGAIALVSDATSNILIGAGGGAAYALVAYNGAAWVAV